MRGSLASTMLLIGVGIFYLASASRYDFGSLSDPKPGFFPTIVGVAFLVLNASLLFVSLRAREQAVSLEDREALGLRKLLPAAAVLGGMVLYVLVVDYVGFLLASTALMMFLLWVGGARNWLLNVVLGAAASGLLYWLFWVVMRVPIPRGALWGG